MATSVFNAGDVRGQDSVAAAARVMANACNQLVSTDGFSPQWALGAGHRLPASLANPDKDPAIISR
eukprot:1055481-Pyramimonas_sp.AAC.2